MPDDIPEQIVIRLAGGREFRNPLLHGIYWSNRILAFAARLPAATLFHSPAPIAGFGRAPKTVVTIHDCLYRTLPNYLGRSGIRKWYLTATERYAAHSELVLTQSEFTRRDLAAKTSIPAGKIKVLSPWVDQSFLDAAADKAAVGDIRRKLALPERFWLYLGGYDYRKNIEFLIEAYAQLRRERALPLLVLAGGIPPRRNDMTCDVLGAMAKSNLSTSDVLMPGFIAASDLPKLCRAASLLIYPSLLEGFGLPPAEAMAVGTPVLASNTSSLPEVVQKIECLFDPTVRESLMEKLRIAADDEASFVAELSKTYGESYGVQRYLELLGLEH